MAEQARRLWDKGGEVDDLVHRFTVGDDPTRDLKLVHADCLGSAAHARTIHRASILNDAELKSLLAGLREIDALHSAGKFTIPAELEDCHTAIEAHLTKSCGAAGEKIHTGRSRNDQVATAMRLWMRGEAVRWLDLLAGFVQTALARIERDGEIEMPGYTHMQQAMPSSIGQWLHAHVEAALEQTRATLDLLDRLDACPLGTGAGFGVPLPLDREFTAKLLGFSRVQRSPIDVQNSRGRMERYFVRVAADIGAVLQKLASDMLIFSTAEFGFFRLPESLTTGSSIMPQKRNPDVLELMRAKSAWLRAREYELDCVIDKLPSSYHRDLQLTKEPALRAADEIEQLLDVAERVIATFEIDRDRLASAMRPELFATEAALRLASKGTPFRQAYRDVAGELRAGRFRVPADRDRSHIVSADLLAVLRGESVALVAKSGEWKLRIRAAERLLHDPADGSPL